MNNRIISAISLVLLSISWSFLSVIAGSNNGWQLIENNESIEYINKENSHKIVIERGDICKSGCQAIVNAANAQLQNGGGVCGAIFKDAGLTKLQTFIDNKFPQGCQTGQAVITPSFDLKKNRGIDYIIHAVGPIWSGGTNNERTLLADTYHNSLLIAQQNNIDSIAFPFISSGIYKFPLKEAACIAIKTVIKNSYLVKEIRIVLFSKADYQLFKEAIKKLSAKEPVGLATVIAESNNTPHIFQRFFN